LKPWLKVIRYSYIDKKVKIF